jgi:carbon-monoxide dehydrogenase medium subunit
MLPSFAIHRPTRLEEAIALINEDALPYWGGTELLLAMKMGLLRAEALVDLKSLSELEGIRREGNALVIGAGTSHDQIASSDLVGQLAPLLSVAERTVGNARVRSQGTIGGNLCFAEPRSDVATVLIALDASLRLISAAGTRSLRVSDFILGPYWTQREPDELLIDISIPLPAAVGVYLKFQTIERPTVSVAAVRCGATGVRIVVGAVSEVPIVVDSDSISELDPAALAAQIEPIPDLTGSVRYKRHVTEVYLRRAIEGLNGAGNV